VPVPRYDLLNHGRYGSISIQYSRGCPFQCEFCDALIAWQEQHGRPFELITEASVNLAEDPELMKEMVRAGFFSVFLGIETPSTAALGSANKLQNLRLDLSAAVNAVTACGLEVMGGFIVGFDLDGPEIFEAQREFIESSPIPLAMVGVLNALPGTPLWHRLRREGRLREDSDGDQFGRPNFEVAMGDEVLLRGYAELMETVYSPGEYYRRCANYMDRVGDRPLFGDRGSIDLLVFAKAIWHIGVVSPRRSHFWKLMGRAALRGRVAIKRAVTHAIMGEHMIRYTEQHVLPTVHRAIAELEAELPVAAPPPVTELVAPLYAAAS